MAFVTSWTTIDAAKYMGEGDTNKEDREGRETAAGDKVKEATEIRLLDEILDGFLESGWLAHWHRNVREESIDD